MEAYLAPLDKIYAIGGGQKRSEKRGLLTLNLSHWIHKQGKSDSVPEGWQDATINLLFYFAPLSSGQAPRSHIQKLSPTENMSSTKRPANCNINCNIFKSVRRHNEMLPLMLQILAFESLTDNMWRHISG